MLTAQLTPTVALQANCSPTAAANAVNQKDAIGFIGYDSTTAQDSAVSMTKQLTPTATAATTAVSISLSSLAPTAISPTTCSPTAATTATNNPTPASSNGNGATSDTGTLRKGGSSTGSTAAQPKLATSGAAANDASGRSAALERAYVHDVYENCEESTGPIRPRVAQFLSNLDPGSVVCDVGCGSGRYLTQCNPAICTVGVDRCYRLSKVAKEKGGEVALCDNLELPFRDESFDAVLSLAVVHHFATTERRVRALRELARILRIGGRVIITVWALEQRHRRFESQDVLIPWQPPKNRNFSCSDEEDDDDFLPPYHAYTEDSTNSSRSAGDGDSSSLSSSSPGESCYSFVRRAIQKLAGGRKHPWFLDSWTSKDTKNDSSLDYEDAKDLPIELRRLEDFEDFPDPPLSAGLKSRSLGSILNPPPRQIVRSRSSVPILGGPVLHTDSCHKTAQNAQFLSALDGHNAPVAVPTSNGPSPTTLGGITSSATSSLGRRPKLIKQKQSLCDEDYQLPETPFHIISNYNSSSNSFSSNLYAKSGVSNQPHISPNPGQQLPLTARQVAQANLFLRKQSSLNEELMAGNRIREKERVRKRIQKQMSLNEAFLCRSAMFSKRLQVIREGFTSKIKSSTGSLERVTKNGFTKIMQNLKTYQTTDVAPSTEDQSGRQAQEPICCQQHQHHNHHHHHHHQQNGNYQSQYPHPLHSQTPAAAGNNYPGPVTYCKSTDCTTSACYCSNYHQGCSTCQNGSEDPETKARRHSRESGSDSSKDSSLQSDTSIESEDSFASVIFIPKPEQHQQQLNYQQQHQNSTSSSSNSSSSNGGCHVYNNCCHPKGSNPQQACKKTNCGHMNGHQHQQQHHRIPSVPTSPLIMPCPPTPAHSPAAAQITVTSPPQTMAAVTAAMAILTPPSKPIIKDDEEKDHDTKPDAAGANKSRFNFDEAHIKQHASQEPQQPQHKQQLDQPKAQITRRSPEKLGNTETTEIKKPTESKEIIQKKENTGNCSNKIPLASKITRQTIRDLPPIPKFRKQQSLQLHRQSFPIVRRSSAASGAIPSMPKLMSLELFNPATDDLDSDSSEPSSPDSIDSVISAPKSATALSTNDEPQKEADTTQASDVANLEDFDNITVKQEQYQCNNGDLKINPSTPNDIILNDDSSNILPTHTGSGKKHSNADQKQKDCAEFAEQLSAQLQREIEDKSNRAECRSLDGIGDIGEYLDDPFGGHKKRNGEQRDLTALRDELRERRLMLANLSTQPSIQHSPTSSSTSSLSSQTRSFTIHEEDELEGEEENESSYTLQLYENCKISKFKYIRNRHYNLNPETAYLLQDDGDSSIRDDDEFDDIEHDVIPEEDEEDAAAEDLEANGGDQLGESLSEYGRKNSRNTIKCDSLEESPMEKTGIKVDNTSGPQVPQPQPQPQQQPQQPQQQQALQNRQSTESWEHSNSSTSLDSPSQGGATTHHRYYHVFREGELDALINHHVASLHIVSSYYERASWCVVAEKVQVWTI